MHVGKEKIVAQELDGQIEHYGCLPFTVDLGDGPCRKNSPGNQGTGGMETDMIVHLGNEDTSAAQLHKHARLIQCPGPEKIPEFFQGCFRVIDLNEIFRHTAGVEPVYAPE